MFSTCYIEDLVYLEKLKISGSPMYYSSFLLLKNLIKIKILRLPEVIHGNNIDYVNDLLGFTNLMSLQVPWSISNVTGNHGDEILVTVLSIINVSKNRTIDSQCN